MGTHLMLIYMFNIAYVNRFYESIFLLKSLRTSRLGKAEGGTIRFASATVTLRHWTVLRSIPWY